MKYVSVEEEIVHGKMNGRILYKILFIMRDWRVILRWFYGRVILYMRRSSKTVMRWACHGVVVIW